MVVGFGFEGVVERFRGISNAVDYAIQINVRTGISLYYANALLLKLRRLIQCFRGGRFAGQKREDRRHHNDTVSYRCSCIAKTTHRCSPFLPHSTCFQTEPVTRPRDYLCVVAISTRRFSALPFAVTLSATGRLAPTPCAFNHAITKAARFCESV